MPIDQLPDPPNRTDGHATFVTKANAFLAALISFVTQANTLETNVNSKEVSASNAAVTAAEYLHETELIKTEIEGNTAAAMHFVGVWGDLTGSLAVPSSVYHNGVYWLLLNDLADITTSEPSESNNDWGTLSDYISRLKKYSNI